ncbi:uncharacterized protein PV09_06179 [Verruconis gallopava]|uniref:Uncharacterized protein n=1 Tax=Verruconis gallopava TaxID=253628 RepID=A0A0D1YNS9_9PEZI|nr:uncharacterized protein PV09_06179 [Verruconis gallopava]KIW02357.1 hypothetical protein PV09_06179 [Verruconis gallopava]
MDVDKTAFPARLLEILEALSNADFVSIDFEFSGIATKPTIRQKQSIQERYVETKQAAEKYQILQVGLTCAILDRKKETYILQPYNLPISPVFDEDLDLERQFSFQSGAVEFLLRNGFNFNLTFENGVPYLSRDEEHEAKEKFTARDDKNRFEDILIAESDTLTLKFLEKVRCEVHEWLTRKKEDSLEIRSRTLHWRENCDAIGDLTSFDKRLIHQLIRNEFPSLVTISRRQSVVIKALDEGREHQIRKEKYRRLKKKIYSQTGFRWIIEALTGGSLANIDLMWFAQDPETGAPRYYDSTVLEARFQRASEKLKRKRPVLVGHNCFTDLIYLYSNFLGRLPDDVSEFQQRIHELFPFVVDTKYMFTHNCGNMNPASSLDSIEESLRVQQKPRIKTHKEHRRYETDKMHHEAGYDSYLTAKVAILLSTKLEAQGMYVLEENYGNNSQPVTPDGKQKLDSRPTASPQAQVISGKVADVSKNTKHITPSPRKKVSPQVKSRFATKTLFEALASVPASDNETEEDESAAVGPRFIFNPNAPPFPIPASDRAVEARSSKDINETATKEELKLDALMPPFHSDFWGVYSNKLRVFGTVEGLLDLDPTRQQCVS